MLLSNDDFGDYDDAKGVGSSMRDLSVEDAEADSKFKDSNRARRTKDRPASAAGRKKGVSKKAMMPPSMAPPDGKAAVYGLEEDEPAETKGTMADSSAEGSSYGLSGALPESTQSRARALAKQRELAMKRRQQAMTSGAMMRGAGGGGLGGPSAGQFTPGVAQFSAPRAIDDDPYGPFSTRAHSRAAHEPWRPTTSDPYAKPAGGSLFAEGPVGAGANQRAIEETYDERMHHNQRGASRPSTGTQPHSVYAEDAGRYDQPLAARGQPLAAAASSSRRFDHDPNLESRRDAFASPVAELRSPLNQPRPLRSPHDDDDHGGGGGGNSRHRQRSPNNTTGSSHRDKNYDPYVSSSRDDPYANDRRRDDDDQRDDRSRGASSRGRYEDDDDRRRQRGGQDAKNRSGRYDDGFADGFDDRYDDLRDDRRTTNNNKNNRRKNNRDDRGGGPASRRSRDENRGGDYDAYDDDDHRRGGGRNDRRRERKNRYDDDDDDDRGSGDDADDGERFSRRRASNASSTKGGSGGGGADHHWDSREVLDARHVPTALAAYDGAETAPTASTAAPATPAFDITQLPLHDMRLFLTQPTPRRAGIVQCYIKRNRAGTNKLFPEYSVYMKEGDRFMMCSKKRPNNKTSNYLISMGQNDLKRTSSNYIGKLRANFAGTEFQIFDAGWNPKDLDNDLDDDKAQTRADLGSIIYTSNVLGSRGPRKMQVAIPKLGDEDRPLKLRGGDILGKMKAHDYTALVHTINKPPRWNDQVGAYVLNFNGRVTMASVKNFQLVQPDDQDSIILQFGRVGKDEFTMDFQYPMTPFQAFAITLSSFDSKIACD